MEHILSLSYGKDSIACLGAIAELGWHLDRIIHAEIWATETISADLPPMLEFKDKADKIIKKRYGITVEHVSAGITYDEIFYRYLKNKGKSINSGHIYGFPMLKGGWCNSRLKVACLNKINKNAISYIGIAYDEPKRFKVLSAKRLSPLVSAKWTEKMCYDWCKKNDLLSPIYESSTRGGCWFCHNQSVEQLRVLRHNYPDLWEVLMQWDRDSPSTFKPDHTVHEFDKRFQLEDLNILTPNDRRFRWKCLNEHTFK